MVAKSYKKTDFLAKIGKWIPVKPIHCHQRLLRNTLITKVRFTSLGKTNAETILKFIPKELPFFFDHNIDHLPGMLEANAMRQATLAMAHLLYGVPINFVALMDYLNVRMINYGELNTPTVFKSRLLNSCRSRHKIVLTFEGLIMQKNIVIMRASGKLIMLSPALGAKTRYKINRENNTK